MHFEPTEGTGVNRHDRGRSYSIPATSVDVLPVVEVVDRGTIEFGAGEYALAVRALVTLISGWSLPETEWPTAA